MSSVTLPKLAGEMDVREELALIWDGMALTARNAMDADEYLKRAKRLRASLPPSQTGTPDEDGK